MFIHQVFEEQARKVPNNIAVTQNQQTITYEQLNIRANKLAHELISRGVDRNTLVAVNINRSIDLVTAILGILKAGSGYLPLDSSYPTERLKFMLSHSKVELVIVQNDNHQLDNQSLTFINIHSELLEQPETNLNLISQDRDLLYVIYTSGSTGKPKGVAIHHSAFANMCNWYINEFKLSEQDNILIFTSFNFDLTQKNLFAPLMVGATVCLSDQCIYDPVEIVNMIEKNNITWLSCTPSALYPIIEAGSLMDLSSLRHLFVGGEPLSLSRLDKLKLLPELQLVNTYGPTECADVCLFYRVASADFSKIKGYVPLGNVIPGMRMHLLNESANVIHNINQVGELCISGIGTGLGYWGNQQLTNKKFISMPEFDRLAKTYHSGDLCKKNLDGNYEFVSRTDFQIKVRGYRVEPGEIEAILKQHSKIYGAYVTLNPKGQDALIAYLESHDSEITLPYHEVISYLKQFVPNYMLPQKVIMLRQFPVTSNNKLDRKKLLALNQESILLSTNNIVQLRSLVQEKLICIAADILSLNSNFIKLEDTFISIGGNSLAIVQFVLRINQAFNVNMSIKSVFLAHNLRQLSETIEVYQQQIATQEPYLSNQKDAVIYFQNHSLSIPQKRIWFIQQRSQNRLIFNNLVTLKLHGSLNQSTLHETFLKLAQRHHLLRGKIILENNRPIWGFISEKELSVKFVDQTSVNKEQQYQLTQELAEQEARYEFDLFAGPLWRVTLVQFPNNEYVLLMNIHQLIIDGWSMLLLYKEVNAIYNNIISNEEHHALVDLPLSYVQYWNAKAANIKKLEQEVNYWKIKLKNISQKICTLPLDHERPEEFSYYGKVYTFQLNHDFSERIRAYVKSKNTTLFIFLLSCFALTLSHSNKEKLIVVGTPVANRNNLDVENLIGFFTNLIPLSLEMCEGQNIDTFLSYVKETAIEAFDHSELPFFDLLEELNIQFPESHHPLFQVLFAMQPYGVHELKLQGIHRIDDLDYEEPITKFDLALNVHEKPSGIDLKYEYTPDLFNDKTISDFAKKIKMTILNILENDVALVTELFNENLTSMNK